MTAPSGPILFNSSTGSDTAASGLGPATALTGAGASTTAASVTVTGIDTTGVSVGNLLWVSSSSGRQFSIIATIIDGTSVTCDDTFANTEASRTWAIGGKRATLDAASSRTLTGTAGAKGGWIIELETNQVFATSNVWSCSGNTTDGWITFRSNDPNTRRTISQSAANTVVLNATGIYQRYEHLKTTRTGTVGASSIGLNTNQTFVARNCEFGDTVNRLQKGVASSGGVAIMHRCYIHDCFDFGISLTARGQVVRCSIRNNTGVGITIAGSDFSIQSCLITGNSDGVFINNNNASTAKLISGNVISNNSSDGINFTTVNGPVGATVLGNMITENAAFGLLLTTANETIETDFNAYLNNTSGNISGTSAGSSDVTITADPFTWSKTLTAVSWAFAGKTLTKVAGFANVHVGQSVNVTGGTGVTPGLYAIASVDSNDQITLVASIAGADTADVTTAPDFNINNHAGGGAALRAVTVVLP